MSDYEWMSRATDAASKIYKCFLVEVLENHLMENDREGISLSEKAQKQIDKGTHIDPRVLRLMSISGKGGYSSDPEKRKLYSLYFNITLLDHQLSVMRGALMMASLDWLARNPEMEEAVLERKLVIIVVIAFMHDTDKDLQLARNMPISLEYMSERMERYGIPVFLNKFGLELFPDQLRYLVEKVEATQTHRHPPEALLPREYEILPRYVRIADQLDSTWLSSDLETGGLHGVIECLQKDQGCLRSDLLKEWKEVRLFDPLHPFLLDELQRYLSRLSLHLTGVPPLIELHQDGHLFMLLPQYRYDEIIQKALNALTNGLPINLYLKVSTPGVPSIFNGKPSYDELQYFISERLDQKQLSDLFKIKQSLKDEIKESLDDLLSEIGLQPVWPAKSTGQLLPIYATFNIFDPEEMEWLYRAACLVMLLNLKVEAKPKDGVLKSSEREIELLDFIDEDRPEWITSVSNDASRRTLTGLWVTAVAAEKDNILKRVWNSDEGLLKQWLEGTDKRPGFRQFFLGDSADITEGVKWRFEQILSKKRVTVRDENAKGRCLFTDEPVDFKRVIKEYFNLYGVNVSAFSGREGRIENLNLVKGHNNIGYSCDAEYRLKYSTYKNNGGKIAPGKSPLPTTISSPVTSGLFGGLALRDDKSMAAMSVYDLSRTEIKKGRVLKGMELYQGRYRIARLERIPEKLEDQVNSLRLLMTACRRTGRPFHLFRGLPMLRKEFFYYDAMPRVLTELVGGNALCLEQLPEAIHQLRMANDLLETNGLGHDVLKLYAMPRTRFGAACMAFCHLKDNEEKKPDLKNVLKMEYMKYLEGEKSMSEQDGALVKLGKAAAGIQKNPGARASKSDELLVFNICLDAVTAAIKDNQTDITSLIYAVAGELETNLVRRDKAGKRENRNNKPLMEGCEDVAEIFVNEVWKNAFGNKYPSQKSRRVLSSIYRVAFLKAHKAMREENSESNK